VPDKPNGTSSPLARGQAKGELHLQVQRDGVGVEREESGGPGPREKAIVGENRLNWQDRTAGQRSTLVTQQRVSVWWSPLLLIITKRTRLVVWKFKKW